MKRMLSLVSAGLAASLAGVAVGQVSDSPPTLEGLSALLSALPEEGVAGSGDPLPQAGQEAAQAGPPEVRVLEAPTGPVARLLAGTVARGHMDVSAVSDYGGPWRGTLMYDVVAGDGRSVVIPRGAVIMGTSSQAGGQNEAIHNRMRLAPTVATWPGGSVSLEGAFVVDEEGIGGIGDQVDYHADITTGAIMAGAALDAGVAYAGRRAGNDPVFGVQEAAEPSRAIVERYTGLVPTVTLRAGTAFAILFTADRELPVHGTVEPYQLVGGRYDR